MEYILCTLKKMRTNLSHEKFDFLHVVIGAGWEL
jgi:hypothetical protein